MYTHKLCCHRHTGSWILGWCLKEIWAFVGLQGKQKLGFTPVYPAAPDSRFMGLYCFSQAAHPNPRAKGHESSSPLHFPAIHPSYYLSRKPDNEKGKTWKKEQIRETAIVQPDKVKKVKIKGRAEVWFILFLPDMHSFIHKDGERTEVRI